MKLLAIMRPRHGVEVRKGVARHAEAELQSLWALYRDGFVREMYSPRGPGAPPHWGRDGLIVVASSDMCNGELPDLLSDSRQPAGETTR